MAMKFAKEIANFLKGSNMSIEELVEEVKKAQEEPKLYRYHINFSYTEYDCDTILAENEAQAIEKFRRIYDDDHIIEDISEEDEVED